MIEAIVIAVAVALSWVAHRILSRHRNESRHVTTISPESPTALSPPGETIVCAYCGRDSTLVDQADLPWPEVGPCCSDLCSIIRYVNTPEWGGA